MIRRSASVLAPCLAGLLAAGCGGFLPRTKPSTFYVLNATAERGAGPALPVALGIGPVELPAYLDRPQVVTRLGTNQLDLSESRRWAEPLQKNVVDVLLLNLARELGTDRVTAFPFAMGLPRDYDVTVQFLRFEATASGEVRLEAYVRLLDGRSGAELKASPVSYTRSVPPDDVAAATAALSDAVGELSSDVAAVIRALHAARS